MVAHNLVVALLNTHLSAQKLGTALYNCVGFMKVNFSGEETQGFRAPWRPYNQKQGAQQVNPLVAQSVFFFQKSACMTRAALRETKKTVSLTPSVAPPLYIDSGILYCPVNLTLPSYDALLRGELKKTQ